MTMSRGGGMKDVDVRIRDSKTTGIAYLSRIAAPNDAQHESHAALDSVVRLKTSRASGPALVPKSAGAGNSGLSRNTPSGGGC
jgi:hypothetical protein